MKVIAVIEALELDPGGRIRAAIEPLESHADDAVAKAASKKLGTAD